MNFRIGRFLAQFIASCFKIKYCFVQTEPQHPSIISTTQYPCNNFGRTLILDYWILRCHPVGSGPGPVKNSA